MQLLHVVAAVASHGSLRQAAEALGVSQPALTKSLREAEKLVGVRLFERHARGVQATAYGAALSEAARKILQTLQQVEEEFGRIDSQLGRTAVIGALPTAAAGVIPEVIRQLKASDPHLEIRVIEGRLDELSPALALGNVDVIVGRLYDSLSEGGRFRGVTLYDEPMSFIVGHQHPLASRSAVSISELLDYEIALPTTSLRVGTETQAFLEAVGLSVRHPLTTTSVTLQRELLLSANVIAVMPSLILKGDIERGTFRLLNVRHPHKPPARPAGLLFRRDQPLSAAAARFVTTVSDYAESALPQYPA